MPFSWKDHLQVFCASLFKSLKYLKKRSPSGIFIRHHATSHTLRGCGEINAIQKNLRDYLMKSKIRKTFTLGELRQELMERKILNGFLSFSIVNKFNSEDQEWSLSDARVVFVNLLKFILEFSKFIDQKNEKIVKEMIKSL